MWCNCQRRSQEVTNRPPMVSDAAERRDADRWLVICQGQVLSPPACAYNMCIRTYIHTGCMEEFCRTRKWSGQARDATRRRGRLEDWRGPSYRGQPWAAEASARSFAEIRQFANNNRCVELKAHRSNPQATSKRRREAKWEETRCADSSSTSNS
jgi:hypothetical protein